MNEQNEQNLQNEQDLNTSNKVKISSDVKNLFMYLITTIILFILFNIAIQNLTFFYEYLKGFSMLIIGSIIYFLMTFTTSFLLSLFVLSNNFMKRSFYKNKKDYDKELIIWLREKYISEKFLFNKFSVLATKDNNDIENLKKIRGILEEDLGDDITNYKLLKNHLEFKNNKFPKKKLNTILITLGSLLFSSIILPYFKNAFESNVVIIEYFKEFISIFPNYLMVDNLWLIFVFVGMILTVYITINQFIATFTEKERSLTYLISILNILIDEKENNNKTGSTSPLEDNNL